MKRIILVCALALALPVTGCHRTSVAPPPPLVNQVNAFDGTSYRTLMVLQASLNSLKSSIQNDSANLGSLKPALNNALTDYNLAVAAWKIYHTTQANQQTVTEALNKTQGDVNSLQTAVKK